jgi:hypothetical protein
MAKLKSVLGTMWALTALPLLLVMFFGFARWPRLLVAATGLEVSPWYTGGEVVTSTPREGYTTLVHRPVFDALLGQKARGFVQIDFVPPEGGALPAVIEESLSPQDNSALAIRVRLDTAMRAATLGTSGTHVLGVEGVYGLKSGLAVRVALRNPA